MLYAKSIDDKERLIMAKKVKLKGHEKFSLREGWLNKGLFGVSQYTKIFTSDNATDVLGVGTNMVKSIRYWLQAFELIDENQDVTEFGKTVLKFDDYFEDDFTLWILHSKIANNPEKATSWFLFFNKCRVDEFTKEEMQGLIKRELFAYAESDKFPDSSINDDLDVLLNMYSKSKDIDDPEDKSSSPFAVLGILKKDENGYLRKTPVTKRFSEMVLLYEITRIIGENEFVSIEKASETMFSLYHLTKVYVNSMLDALDDEGYIRVDRTAGLDMIYMNKTLSPDEVIEEYYKNR